MLGGLVDDAREQPTTFAVPDHQGAGLAGEQHKLEISAPFEVAAPEQGAPGGDHRMQRSAHILLTALRARYLTHS